MINQFNKIKCLQLENLNLKKDIDKNLKKDDDFYEVISSKLFRAQKDIEQISLINDNSNGILIAIQKFLSKIKKQIGLDNELVFDLSKIDNKTFIHNLSILEMNISNKLLRLNNIENSIKLEFLEYNQIDNKNQTKLNNFNSKYEYKLEDDHFSKKELNNNSIIFNSASRANTQINDLCNNNDIKSHILFKNNYYKKLLNDDNKLKINKMCEYGNDRCKVKEENRIKKKGSIITKWWNSKSKLNHCPARTSNYFYNYKSKID